MEFDYSKLRGRIKEKCRTQLIYATKLGKSEAAISARLNNVCDFSQDEIIASCEILDIPHTDINLYFFTPEVQIRELEEA